MIGKFLLEVWHILLTLSPWLFFGAFIAGLLKIFMPEDFVNKHMGHAKFSSIIKTTLIGIPLPLCSCGVLPTALGLKKSGANNGATMGFLISTPQTGVDSILVTASFLGWPLALFKVLAALLTGLIGGLFQQLSDARSQSTTQTISCSKNDDWDRSKPTTKKKWTIFYNYSIQELIGGIYGYLSIGVIIAALVSVLFPSQLLTQYPALQGPLGMLVMLVLATPLYICTTGSVPIAASFIQAGLPVGSALVFLIAGPATNAATMGAVYKSFGKKFLMIYLGTVIISSVAFGLIFQFWIGDTITGLTAMMKHHETGYWIWIERFSAIILLAFIGYWLLTDIKAWLKTKFYKPALSSCETITFNVKGMTCKNCLTHVKRSLEIVKGVENVSLSLETGATEISGHHLSKNNLFAAVISAGYKAYDGEPK